MYFLDDSYSDGYIILVYRVPTVMENPEKSWNFFFFFSGLEKSWGAISFLKFWKSPGNVFYSYVHSH